MKPTSKKSSQIKCLFSAVEADPFVKVGGLADVAYALPQALRSLSPEDTDGHSIDVRLVLPCHSTACLAVENIENRITFDVLTKMGPIKTIVFETAINGLPIYLISSPLIPKDTSVYSTDEYHDGLKFFFFSMASLELAKLLKWQPDIVHVNDWHTAITPHLFHHQNHSDSFFAGSKSVLTIHNLPFMGTDTEQAMKDIGIPFRNDIHLPTWARKMPLPIGLSASDQIIAVSPTYAQEILTPEFGCGLEDYLSSRKESLFGIINGIDTDLWNPETDKDIFTRYSVENVSERKNNKHALQKEMAFSLDPDIPLLIFIGRMDFQKGIDLILDGLKLCKDLPWQLIILGTGNPALETAARQFETEHPDKVRAVVRFDSKLARRMYAGADILLMPSRYEPCGLAQMIAMRYGCIPLARSTGGLRDTIIDLSANHTATGFLFAQSTKKSFADSIRKACAVYNDKPMWNMMQINGMNKDFSWHKSALSYAERYINLFRSVL